MKDPVCGMEIDPKTAKFKSVYQVETYYFCSESDKKMFDAIPRGYIGERPKEQNTKKENEDKKNGN